MCLTVKTGAFFSGSNACPLLSHPSASAYPASAYPTSAYRNSSPIQSQHRHIKMLLGPSIYYRAELARQKKFPMTSLLRE